MKLSSVFKWLDISELKMPKPIDLCVLIDGEYIRKIFINQSYKLDVPKLVNEILKKLSINRDDLLRAYYYTSPPFQSSNPTDEEKIRYAAAILIMN